MKEHVAARRWQSGGFHVLRYIECRCGETFVHYNAGEVRRMFRVHQAAASPVTAEANNERTAEDGY